MAYEFAKYVIPQKYYTQEYTEQLKKLFPRGLLWKWGTYTISNLLQDVISGAELQDSVSSPSVIQDVIDDPGSTGHLFTRFLSCFASELSRVEGFAWDLLAQSDPGVATTLLEDWERVLGLPGPCEAGLTLTIEDRQRRARAKLLDEFQTATEQYYIDYAASLGFTVTIEEIPAEYSPRIMGIARMGVERMGGRGGFSIMQVTVVSGTGNLDQLRCAFNSIKPAHVVIVWA